jgi:glycosyltransferase involved in cell wall biosynthesis
MSESLQILRVSTDTYPEILGGGALHAHEMSKLQAERGHDVTLLTSDHGDHNAPRREERAGYTVRRYEELARPFGSSITLRMVPDLWRLTSNNDIVHAHSHLYFSSNVAAVLRHFNGTPLLVTNHGLYSQTAPEIIQDAFMRTVAKFTFNSVDRVLCYTKTDHDRLRNRSITAPISVIHNGIDCETFTPEAGEDRKSRVLFVGRFNKSKGVHRLVRAFAGLTADISDVGLTLVGDGPLENHLKESVRRYGIDDRVSFEGRLPNEALPAIYAESTVFALPSDAEGLPRTVLESLACETPVVTSALPQLEPLVESVGETVPKKTVTELETALRKLLTNQQRRRELGKRGRERVVENYSWAETVEETTEQYYELIDR